MATTQPYSDLSIDVGERPRRTNCRNSAILVIVAIAVIIVAVIALAVPLGVIRSRSSTNAGYQTTTNAGSLCLTRECVKLSAAVFSAIDESADPCTDFYQFSCGNWVEDAVIPPCELCDMHTLVKINLVYTFRAKICNMHAILTQDC